MAAVSSSWGKAKSGWGRLEFCSTAAAQFCTKAMTLQRIEGMHRHRHIAMNKKIRDEELVDEDKSCNL